MARLAVAGTRGEVVVEAMPGESLPEGLPAFFSCFLWPVGPGPDFCL